MVYQGSKRKILKDILPFIQNCINDNNVETYIEPFVGGANVIDSVVCKNRIGSDLNDELISLLIYMRDNPSIPFAPTECSFEHYCEVREDRKNKTNHFTKEYVAMIGYFASYGGRYFDGGYGRDAKGSRSVYSERLNFARNQAPKLEGIEFKSCSFEEYNPKEYNNCVFYLDPPYKDTNKYNVAKDFDHEKFYDWCERQTELCFISEYEMPRDRFTCIAEFEHRGLISDKENQLVIERVFLPNHQVKDYKVPDIFDII